MGRRVASPRGFEAAAKVDARTTEAKSKLDQHSPPDLRAARSDTVSATSGHNDIPRQPENRSGSEITDDELRAPAMAALTGGRMGDAQAATVELARRELLRGLKPKRATLRRIK